MRLSGNYVAVATMGFLIIVHSIAVNWDDVTRGARGLSQIPTSTNPWVAYIWAAIAVYVALRLRNSPYGRAMIASRENLIASRGVGINVLRSRLLAFVVSAFLTGVAGALLAHQIGTVAPSGFYFATTFTVIIMVVLGGMGSISGAVVGAIIMTMVPELLRPIEDGGQLGPLEFGALYGISNIILAVGFILIMIFRPQGLFGERELGLALFGPAHAATGVGRRGHRRDAGDGARGRRADPRSPSLSSSTPDQDVESRFVRARGTRHAKFHIQTHDLVRCEGSTLQKASGRASLPMARAGREAAWSS